MPDAHARSSILQLITKGLNIDSDINYDTLGRLTPGFVGADLKALASEAGTRAVRRIVASGRPVGEVFGESLPLKLPQPSFNTLNEDGKATTGMRAPNSVVSWKISSAPAIKTEMEIDSPNSATDGDLFCFDGNSLTLQPRESDSNSTNNDSLLLPSGANYVCVPYAGLVVKMQDFTEAIKCIQPTAKREGFAVAPDVSWADVGALAEVYINSHYAPELLCYYLILTYCTARFARSCFTMCWSPSRTRSCFARSAWRCPPACCSSARQGTIY